MYRLHLPTFCDLLVFFMAEVQASRVINSNGKGRGKLAELIITNYLPEGGENNVS